MAKLTVGYETSKDNRDGKMTADTDTETTPATKPKKVKAVAVDAPAFLLGDDVYFSPPQAARDALRSNRGLDVTEWAAKIVFVNGDGTYQLRVFRPFGLGDELVWKAAHDAGGSPGTFRARG